MGTIFEELVRRFNEENNEEAGEHWTPRDAVKLMANLIFLPIADKIESGTYLLYDGACGTGGMLTVAEETLQQLAEEHGKKVARISTVRRSTPRPTPSARPTCCSREKARTRTTSSAARNTRHWRTTRSHRASSTSCSRIRRTGRAGRATSNVWAARTASKIRDSSSSMPAIPNTRSSPAPATARCCSSPTCSAR